MTSSTNYGCTIDINPYLNFINKISSQRVALWVRIISEGAFLLLQVNLFQKHLFLQQLTHIEGKTTSRNDGSMTDQGQNGKGQENEEPRVSEDDDTTNEAGDEFNDPNKEKEKRN